MQSGQKKKAVILNVDMLKLEVHVSLCHDLVNRKAKKVSLLMTSIPMVLKALRAPSTPSLPWWVIMQMPVDRDHMPAFVQFIPSLYLSSWCDNNSTDFHSGSCDRLYGHPVFRARQVM